MIAISTAFKRALIGIEIDKKRECFELDANCKHSENILLNIDKLLDKIEKSFQENDSYGVVIGPGSFTGVRIATSLVKGFLAGEQNKKIVTLTSFELMAYTYIKHNHVENNFVCAIDALSGLYFICEFDKDGNKISQERMIDNDEFQKITLPVVSLSEEDVSLIKITPSAEELLDLCMFKLSRENLSKTEEILPLYLRKSQAEVSLEERLKKS